jgi:hypothetical protein
VLLLTPVVVDAVADTLQGWVVLGAVDLDQYVEDTVHTAQEFDMNFRALKARRKDAEKVRSDTPLVHFVYPAVYQCTLLSLVSCVFLSVEAAPLAAIESLMCTNLVFYCMLICMALTCSPSTYYCCYHYCYYFCYY